MSERLIIIGSGPAGLTAAIYAARANLKPLLFEGFQAGGIPGGQLMITTIIENFPGFPTGISGPQLMANMREQSLHYGTRMVTQDIIKADFSKHPYTLTTMNEEKYTALAVIVATGATARRLPIGSGAGVFQRARPATAPCPFSATKIWELSAAEILPSRRRCISPSSLQRCTSFTAVMNCARARSCRSGRKIIRKSSSSGTRSLKIL
jgi:alkyl hydroperoxide reductase subunit AhpF